MRSRYDQYDLMVGVFLALCAVVLFFVLYAGIRDARAKAEWSTYAGEHCELTAVGPDRRSLLPVGKVLVPVTSSGQRVWLCDDGEFHVK